MSWLTGDPRNFDEQNNDSISMKTNHLMNRMNAPFSNILKFL